MDQRTAPLSLESLTITPPLPPQTDPCPVCLLNLTIPRRPIVTLPCTHQLCGPCYIVMSTADTNLPDAKKLATKCPLCRAPTHPIPNNADIAFIGVPEYIMDNFKINTWSEGVHVYESYDTVPIDTLKNYSTVVISDSSLEYDPARFRLHKDIKVFYENGDRVVVLAVEGIFSVPDDIVSVLFDCRWKFGGYTKHQYKLTVKGAEVLGGNENDDAHCYTKGNLLNVPEGEALLIPRLSFYDCYGYSINDVDDQLYDSDDAETYNSTPVNKSTPVALHTNLNTTGSRGDVVWMGFVNYDEEEMQRIFEWTVRPGKEGGCFPFVRKERSRSRGVAAVF